MAHTRGRLPYRKDIHKSDTRYLLRQRVPCKTINQWKYDVLGKSSKPSNTKVHIKRIRATHHGQHVSYDKYQTVMSKLLTPKIHTSSSSTKIPRMIYTLLNQNTHTIPTSATPNTQLSPAPTQHTLRITKCIYYPFLNQNTPSLPQP
nr:MAG TPA: hypothetical protein [Crassvirales sp.]